MGKTKVIAETGAGQHGVATATGAALFGMECTVYMGAEDIERQSLNVFRMEMLGAKVQAVTTGIATLKDATPISFTSLSSIKSANIPIELEPPPTQATTASGSRPSFSNICLLASVDIILWNSLTILGYG